MHASVIIFLMLSIASPLIEEEEIKAVNEVLLSGMLAQGPKVAELEKNWAKYCGTKYAVAVNSGTAAIHSALFAAGVKEGDEVITTPFSFIATINPILMLGAKPVLVDINPENFNIDESAIEKAVTKKTKAILPVHLYGQPCDMDKINAIAQKYSLGVIEDACQAIGSAYKGKKAGNLGDLGCFSLYATKNIMSGEGGVVTTNSEDYAYAIKRFRQHGMNSQYQYEHLGFNYRTTDLCAAIANEQLKKVDNLNGKRQKNAKIFDKELSNTKGLILPKVSDGTEHVYHQYTIRVDVNSKLSRDGLVQALRDQGVGAGVYYPKPLHYFDHIAKYGYRKGSFPIAEKISEEVLSLPVHPMIKDEDAHKMAQIIKKALA